MKGLFIAVAMATLACGPQSATAQGTNNAPTPSNQQLVLRDLDGRGHAVTPAELARLPHRDTTVSSHRVEGRYSGVSLVDLLALVHTPAGDSIRGKALAMYIAVEGADGYRAVFALAELDPAFNDHMALLADRRDGAALSASEGPYRLIVPGDKRPARWVRQVTRIEVRRSP